MGNAFAHIVIDEADTYARCEAITSASGKVIRPAGPVVGGSTIIAFVEDPDGYKIELIQMS